MRVKIAVAVFIFNNFLSTCDPLLMGPTDASIGIYERKDMNYTLHFRVYAHHREAF